MTKNHPYVSFEVLSAKTAVWHRHWFYRCGQTIKKGWNWTGHQIQKGWCFLRLNRFCHWVGRGATRLTNQTKKVTLRIFRKKKEGILGYSDYKKTKYRLGYYLLFAIMTIWLIIVLVPFFWLFFTSFKSATEIYQSPSTYTFFPQSFDFGKYGSVIGKSQIWQNVGNSLLIALGSAIASILFNGLLAYVVAILKPKGAKVIYYLILGSMLIPATIALFPLFQNITGLINGIGKIFGLSPTKMSHSALSMIPLMLIAGASPFNFLLFYNYFQGLPQDLFDSAQLDGATRGQIFFKIVVPLSKPILMVVGIFAVTAAWNDFLLPYLLLSNDSLWTVMVKIFSMNSNLSAYGLTLDGFLCLLIFTMIPPILVFFVFQKNITSNVATAGLK